MGIISEFKAFAMRGNVVDMAVGVILGGAFGLIVSSLVTDVMMPPLGVVLGGVDFSELALQVKAGTPAVVENGVEVAKAVDPVVIKYGIFINAVIKFIIVAFALFMVIKAMNTLKKKEEAAPAAPPAPTKEEMLLTEIRDLLANRR